jgi:hypothetical protein
MLARQAAMTRGLAGPRGAAHQLAPGRLLLDAIVAMVRAVSQAVS